MDRIASWRGQRLRVTLAAMEKEPASPRPRLERMPHVEARRILHDLWAAKQVEAHQADPETKLARLLEVEALSVAITALEMMPD